MNFTKTMVSVCVVLVAMAGSALAVAPFSIVAIPDTQYELGSMGTMTQWIVNNKGTYNIKFATHEGDITGSGGSSQWPSAAAAMYKLDGQMPWGTVPGNHDYYGISGFDTYFGPSHFAGQSWYGGSMQQSSFVFFQGGERTYMGLEIQNNAPAEVLTWAQGVLNSHPDNPVVLTTHDYLSDGTSSRSAYGETLWNNLVKTNDQIFMVLAGHIHANDGEFNQTSTNASGHPVFEMLADYQGRVNGGDGLLRLVTLDEDNSKINVKTRSATTGNWETDADSQFSLDMDFATRLVPEPASMSLLGIGALALVRRRRR